MGALPASHPPRRHPETRPPRRLAVEVRVRGVVQGVGFRPFVHRLALRHRLVGSVRNDGGGVRIVFEGAAVDVRRAVTDLEALAPPLARIDALAHEDRAPTGSEAFSVLPSDVDRGEPGRLPVAPDLTMCDACAAEVEDPTDRRYGYAFNTCTDCGPRYTLIEAMPYDRARTSMADFDLCPSCAEEYADPRSRRYHAETVACPRCGPRLRTLGSDGGRVEGTAALELTAARLRGGAIVGVKGIGGYHLAVDATDDDAVRRLRERKRRDAKPFALMVRDAEEAERLAELTDAERAMLVGRERPVVLLRRRLPSTLADSVAPGLDTVGVMLPYSPLHRLLLEAVGRPLVMTSGNRSGLPICADDAEAEVRLDDIVDAFLHHDRRIVARCDDSVVRLGRTGPILLRRARGWAPLPAPLPIATPCSLLAVGAHLKSTITLAEGDEAWVSPHLGDLEDLETLDHVRATLGHLRTLSGIEPSVVVHDLHPGYLSTRLAEELADRREVDGVVAVQHHHAHAAAVLAEHGCSGPAVALTLDGTGYGLDGRVWGAEVLVADLEDFRRRGRLRYTPMPGGDLAARAPWRCALGFSALDPGARESFSEAFSGIDPEAVRVASLQVDRAVHAPEASSAGRLFDAAAAILGIRRVSRHEAHAAMELEAIAGRTPAAAIPMPIRHDDELEVLDPVPLLVQLGERRARGDDIRTLAASFHDSVADAWAGMAIRTARSEGLDTVALGGGSFQNARLLDRIDRRLEAAGLHVLIPHHFSPNDGSVSYGQAAVAAARLART